MIDRDKGRSELRVFIRFAPTLRVPNQGTRSLHHIIVSWISCYCVVMMYNFVKDPCTVLVVKLTATPVHIVSDVPPAEDTSFMKWQFLNTNSRPFSESIASVDRM